MSKSFYATGQVETREHGWVVASVEVGNNSFRGFFDIQGEIAIWCHDNCTDAFVVLSSGVAFRNSDDAVLFKMAHMKPKSADGGAASFDQLKRVLLSKMVARGKAS